MQILADLNPTDVAVGLFVAFVAFAGMLAIEARALAKNPKPHLITSTLNSYATCLLAVALIAGWLAIKLSFSTCQPIPDVTVAAVLDRLDAQDAEAAK